MKVFIIKIFAFLILTLIISSCNIAKIMRDINQSIKTPDNALLYKNATNTNKQEYIDYIKENAPSEDAFVALQRLSAPLIEQQDWPNAIKLYEEYKPLFPEMSHRFDKIIAILKSPSEKLKVTNLGNGINTQHDEFLPVVTTDGQTIFFAGSDDSYRNYRRGATGGEDIYYSNFSNGKWQLDKPIGSPINTTSNDAPMSISADGNQLILFGNYTESFGRGDLFYTEKTKTGWSDVKHYYKPINSTDWESDGRMTADGKAMLFASDRKGGVGEYVTKSTHYHGDVWGNIDIYVCIKTKDGWSAPINLGPTINTPFTERSPFLHPDGKTLYFCSDGHAGLGRLDVYKSTKLNDDSWTEWSEPINLGKDINTPENDWGYVISTDGKKAYFSSIRENGFGGSDLYEITLPEIAKPKPVATITGFVRDNDGNPLEADIVWEDLTLNKEVGRLKSNPQDGSYFIVLPLGKKYGFHAEKEGYFPVSNSIDLTKEKDNVSKKVDITLYKKEKIVNKSIVINNIYFDFDKDILKPESFPELDRLVKFLSTDLPNVNVEISGHTDNKGSDSYNLDLSQRRAQAVVNYLIDKGIAKSRLKAVGYGKTKPIATNDTEEGRATNRRVEFKILK